MFAARKRGIVAPSVLDGAADDGPCIKLPVGIRDHPPVDASRFRVERSPVVLGCLGYGFYLFAGEKALQLPVRKDDSRRIGIVVLPSELEARIVVSGCRIDHFLVKGILSGKLQARSNHRPDVICTMGGVESGIARDDVPFDVCSKFGTYHSGK